MIFKIFLRLKTIRGPGFILYLYILSLFLFNLSFASEVDNFTQRYEPLKDSTTQINEMTDNLFKEIVKSLNGYSVSCSDKVSLMGTTFDVIGGHWWIGTLEHQIDKSEQIPKHKLERANTIYPNNSISEWWTSLPLSSSVKVNGSYIGTDKIGHFIDEGALGAHEWTVDRLSTRKKPNLDKFIQHQMELEEHEYGLTTTHVKSYADLAAATAGMKFWIEFNAKNGKPYLSCQKGKWRFEKGIDWATQVDDSWDEGINCSEFTVDMKSKVDSRIRTLEKKYSNQHYRFQCPVDIRKCQDIAKKHMQLSNFLISPECLKYTLPINSPQTVISPERSVR